MTPEQFLQRVKELRLVSDIPRLVRGWELQRAVIRALNELALATGLGSDTRISKAQLAADVAEQALSAFEKEMENWT